MSGGVAYIGAGLDLSVLAIFKDENLFVLVDSNPRSPYGLLGDHIKTSKAFIPRLENELKEAGKQARGNRYRFFLWKVIYNPVIPLFNNY
jgi:hypothetical protein